MSLQYWPDGDSQVVQNRQIRRDNGPWAGPRMLNLKQERHFPLSLDAAKVAWHEQLPY